MMAPQETEIQNLEIRPCHGLEELSACVELQSVTWGRGDGDVVPRRVFVVCQDIGGQVLGAWDGVQLAGFVMALPGLRDGEYRQGAGGVYLHSHMLAVRMEYRNRGVARMLKLAQRKDAIARGIDRIEWTFDPLEAKNAYFNLHRLGAVVCRYLPDHYGVSSSLLQGGLPTDRLVAKWWLKSAHVKAAIGEQISTASPHPAARTTTQQAEITIERIALESNTAKWKQADATRHLAFEAQRRIRGEFQAAFNRNLMVVGFDRRDDGSGVYLLGKSQAVKVGTQLESAERAL